MYTVHANERVLLICMRKRIPPFREVGLKPLAHNTQRTLLFKFRQFSIFLDDILVSTTQNRRAFKIVLHDAQFSATGLTIDPGPFFLNWFDYLLNRNLARGSGEHCKPPPVGPPICMHFKLENCIWWWCFGYVLCTAFCFSGWWGVKQTHPPPSGYGSRIE